MSKTTKIVAALGIVAGLGVAALPSFTYATQEQQEIYGDVDVVVEVQPAIAMTITGNNDDGSYYYGEARYTEVTPEGTEDPSDEGWYEYDSDAGEYVETTDPTVDSSKTYYEESSEYNAVASFAPDDIAGKTLDGYTVPATSVMGTSSSYASLSPANRVLGDSTNGFRSTVTVYTNNVSGYTLSIRDNDSTTNLTHTNGTSYIPAANGEVTAGTAAWNYDTTVLQGGTVEAKTATAITAADVNIDGLSSKTTNGRVTVVDYNVATAGDQEAGIYSDVIVYTATTN